MTTIRKAARVVIDAISPSLRYTQGSKKNIMLFASRRGGSSILSQLLSAQPYVRDVDQPFDLNRKDDQKSHIKIKHLPAKYLSQFCSLNAEEKRQVTIYLEKILSGQLPELGRYIYASRTVLKIVNASPCMDFLATSFDVDVIYLSRHPLSQSLSIVRNDWAITAEAYLVDQAFVDKYLSKEQQSVGQSVMASGSYLEQAVLNWCLENLVPLRYSEVDKFTITYEELATHADPILQELHTKFKIDPPDRLREIANRPSRSSAFSDKSTLKSIESGNKLSLISKWFDRVSEQEKEKTQAILRAFGIDHYNAFDIFPNKKMLRHPLPSKKE